MSDYHSFEDPDYYVKRSRNLLQNDYPIEISCLNFTQADPLLIRWHWHEEIELEYIVSGQVYVTCEEENILASQGDLVFINQNVRHFITPVQTDYENYLSEIREILSLNDLKEDGYELLTKSVLLRIWYQLYKMSTALVSGSVPKTAVQDEQRVKQAILYIQEHFMETVTLEDIAGSIMVSKSECCRCFKRTLNTTPFEYLMKYRIMESTKRMHRKPQESISEIAGSVGFNNTSYYNKIFRKYMDCTPTEYRNSIKKELPKLT